MIKTITSALATIALLCTTYSANAVIKIGESIPMPGKMMRATNGKMVSLEQVKTPKGLVVMFSCNTCPFVVKSQDRTREMMEFAKAKGFGFIIINSNEGQREEEDSFDEMIKYAKSQRYNNVPYVEDVKSELANLFGATRTPEVFLFNGDGKLAYTGAMEDNPSNPKESKVLYLRMAMDAVAAGRPCEPSTTKSIGCGIKRAE